MNVYTNKEQYRNVSVSQHKLMSLFLKNTLTFRTFFAKMSYFIIKKLLLLGKEKLQRNFLYKWSKVNPGVRFGTKAAWLNRGRLHLCACDSQQRAGLQLHTCLLITRLGLPAGTISAPSDSCQTVNEETWRARPDHLTAQGQVTPAGWSSGDLYEETFILLLLCRAFHFLYLSQCWKVHYLQYYFEVLVQYLLSVFYCVLLCTFIWQLIILQIKIWHSKLRSLWNDPSL